MRGRTVAPRRSRSAHCLLLLCLAGSARADPPPTTDAEAELARVFPQRRHIARAPVILLVNEVEIPSDGPLLLELGPASRSPSAPAAPILAALTPRLRVEARPRLLATVHDHQVSLAALRALGLAVTYDPQRLELRIVVPARLMVAASHDLGSGVPASALGGLPPSTLSGYINLRGGGGGGRSDGVAAPSPLHLHTDTAIQLRGLVLEASADLARGSPLAGPVAVHRGDVMVTRDVAPAAVRYVAGDVGVPTAGLQPSYPVLGLSVARNFALQPYRAVQPIGSFELLLDQPATVTVRVNGAAVQTLRLPSGRHDIRDLPLGAGVNDIELLIKDDAGARAGIERRVRFSAASPDALLAPGISQFALSVGFPRTSDSGLRTYAFARPVVSGRRRWGVTDALTLATSFDGDLDQQVGGGGFAVATRLGQLAVETAASHEASAGVGVAAGARYDHRRATRTFTVAGRHASRGFRSFGPQASDGRYSSELAVAASGHLSDRTVARLDLGYQLGRAAPDAQAFALGISRSFGRLALDASVRVLRNAATQDEARLFVTARWALPRQGITVRAASRASSATGVGNEVTFGRRSSASTGGLAASLRLSEQGGARGADAGVGYASSRFTTALTAGANLDGEHGTSSQTAALEVATALAFAGGRVAWSRPITGSFAIVTRNPVLGETPVGVNPALGSFAATADGFGPAVVPNLEPYRVGRITVEAPALALGSSLGPASYTLLPTYKSGTLVRVGEDGVVFARGVLLHRDGAPLAFAVAALGSLDDPSRVPIVLMTNRTGRFSVIGLRPGRYGVRLSGETATAAELVIPAGTVGVYMVGRVELR